MFRVLIQVLLSCRNTAMRRCFCQGFSDPCSIGRATREECLTLNRQSKVASQLGHFFRNLGSAGFQRNSQPTPPLLRLAVDFQIISETHLPAPHCLGGEDFLEQHFSNWREPHFPATSMIEVIGLSERQHMALAMNDARLGKK